MDFDIEIQYSVYLPIIFLILILVICFLVCLLNRQHKTKLNETKAMPQTQKKLPLLQGHKNSNFKSGEESSSRLTFTSAGSISFFEKGDCVILKGNSPTSPKEKGLKVSADLKLRNSLEAPVNSASLGVSGSSSSLTVTTLVNSTKEEKPNHYKGLWSDRIKEKSEFFLQENNQLNTSSTNIDSSRNPNVKESKFKKSLAIAPKKASLFERVKTPKKGITKSDCSISKDAFTYSSSAPNKSDTKSVIEKKENLFSTIADSNTPNTHKPECFVTFNTGKPTMTYTDKDYLQAKVVTPNISDSKSNNYSKECAVNTLVTGSAATMTVHNVSKKGFIPTKANEIGLVQPKVQLTVEGFMDTDDDDKENSIISRSKECNSQMDEDVDDLNLNDDTSEMDSSDGSVFSSQKNHIHIHSMDLEYTNKNRKKYLKLNEENMNCEIEDINETETMLTDASKTEPYIDEDSLMVDDDDLSNNSTSINMYLGQKAVKSIAPKNMENQQCTIKTNEKQTLTPVSNVLSTRTLISNKPKASDPSLYYRKTLNRVSINSEQKKFVPGQIVVSVIPSGQLDDKTMVGIKFRRPMLSSPDITKFPENSGIKEELLLTTDCCQKKEKKRMMNSVENAEPESDDPDSQMIKIKKSQKDRDLPKTHLVKRKARWSLSKTLMKKKNLDLKVEKPMTSDFISDMDVNSIEVSGIDCDICKRRFPYPECTWCPNNDKICLNCIREVIRHTMDNRKLHLSCPKESCMVSINLDLLSKKVDPVTVEILGRKLQKWLERAHMEEFERLFGKVSCPQCHTQSVLDKEEIHFICSNCRLELCSYCQQLWSSNISHNECRLLNYSGQKCFKESQDLPANWDKKEAVLSENNETIIGVEAQSSVSLKSNEGKTVIRLFCETLKGTQVTAISRIQNIKLWEKYVLKRKHMIDEIGLSKIKERVLFHGTEASNIPLICDEGFDMRVKTANGAVYGKGIYFSTTSHYSKRYAGSSNQMFLARVLCGYSTRGSQEMTRPPKHQRTGRMYDSCVNDIAKPTIYSLFDNAQCYPAYMISYK